LIHTGDFKLDPDPGLSEAHDPEAWAEAARPGIHALICDSTNVFSPHPGRSESSLPDNLHRFVADASGMVVATTFASNIARVRALAEAGIAAGRSVALLGRAMQKMVRVAEETGVIDAFPPLITAEDAGDLPRGQVMLIVTGSQGETRAASAQLARGRFLGLELKEGDSFLFSSKTIPGNERAVLRIVNALSEKGVTVVDGEDGAYHVSGHANRPDLQEVHRMTDAHMVIPMHGEHRHLRAHRDLAEADGRASVIAPNGTLVDITGDKPVIAGKIEAGRVYVDGRVRVGARDGVVRDRLRLARNGLLVVTMILEDDDTPIGAPWVEVIGLSETGRSGRAVSDRVEAALERLVGGLDGGVHPTAHLGDCRRQAAKDRLAHQKVPDIEFHDLRQRGNRRHRVIGQPVAGMHLEPQRIGHRGHLGQPRQFGIAVVEPPFGMGVAIAAGMQFDHRGADPVRGLDLAGIGGDEDRDPTARIAQGRDEMGQPVFLARDFKTAFGCLLLALFGDDAHRVGFVAQCDRLHFGRRRHLEVQRHRQDVHKPVDIGVRYVPAILAQMRGDAIGAGVFGQPGRAQGIGIGAAARIPHGRHMVDVHTQAQMAGHGCGSSVLAGTVVAAALRVAAICSIFSASLRRRRF
jgi:hypothetical protein